MIRWLGGVVVAGAASVLLLSLAACGGGAKLATITSVEADGPELRVGYQGAICSESVTAHVTSDTRESVTIEVRHSGADCDDPPAGGFTTIELDELLGTRTVIDAKSGRTVDVDFATAG